MKKQILFIHSAGPQGEHEGSSDLVAWLQKELGHEYKIDFPKMPNADNPTYASWSNQLAKELDKAEDGVVLVGHSLGGSVLLKYLSENPFNRRIAGMFLVSMPYWGKQDWEVDEYALEEDFASKLPAVPMLVLYHSRNDKEVPFAHLRAYAKKLPSAFVCELEGNNHEYNKGLPELAQDIKNLKNLEKSRQESRTSTA